jgi:hypothetical protein
MDEKAQFRAGDRMRPAMDRPRPAKTPARGSSDGAADHIGHALETVQTALHAANQMAAALHGLAAVARAAEIDLADAGVIIEDMLRAIEIRARHANGLMTAIARGTPDGRMPTNSLLGLRAFARKA